MRSAVRKPASGWHSAVAASAIPSAVMATTHTWRQSPHSTLLESRRTFSISSLVAKVRVGGKSPVSATCPVEPDKATGTETTAPANGDGAGTTVADRDRSPSSGATTNNIHGNLSPEELMQRLMHKEYLKKAKKDEAVHPPMRRVHTPRMGPYSGESGGHSNPAVMDDAWLIDTTRKRESWEYTPTPEHKSLVLMLYRNILKGLMNYKSVRRRSMMAYCRFAFRRRGKATEKLLVDECIEEARRAVYVLDKHHTFTKTKTYEFDTMGLPKDTGQDVKTYMEEVYDPEVSRQQFQHYQDVQPGKEHLHAQRGLGPTSGSHHWKDQSTSSAFKVEIRDEDKAMRPPPPPLNEQ